MSIFIFGNTPIYLMIIFYLAKKPDLSGEINMEMCMIEKRKKSITKKL